MKTVNQQKYEKDKLISTELKSVNAYAIPATTSTSVTLSILHNLDWYWYQYEVGYYVDH